MKALVILILPFAIVWAALSRIWIELKNIPRLVWCDACLEVEAAKRQWNELTE